MVSATAYPTLKRLLQQYEDPTMRSRILELVQKTGVQENDPVFLILVGTAQVQGLLESGPKQLQQTFEYAHQQILGKLQGYEQAARRGVEDSVAKSVESLVQKTAAAKSRVTWLSLCGGCVAIAGVLLLGIFGGVNYHRFTTSYDPAGPRQLTLDEAQALKWAMSPEGQYAQKIMTWNEDLLGGECDQQVQDLGVTIQMGTRKASSGFCLLWIAPPEDRQFMTSDVSNEGG